MLSIILIYLIDLLYYIIYGFKKLNEKIKILIKQSKNERSPNSFNLINNNNSLKKVNKKKKRMNKKNIINPNTNSSNKVIELKDTNNLGLKENNKKVQIDNKKIKNESKIEIKYNNSELNIIDYEEAKKLDKRGYFDYYISLIKTRHPLISSFLPNNDNSSMAINICLFFFSFALAFIVNAFFFTDETMHKIYEDEGIFNFIYNLPKIIYSTIISSIIDIIIKQLALYETSILDIIKEKKDLNKANKTKKIYYIIII